MALDGLLLNEAMSLYLKELFVKCFCREPTQIILIPIQ